MANGITFHALHSLVCIDGFLNDVILLVHLLLSLSSNFWAPLDSISATNLFFTQTQPPVQTESNSYDYLTKRAYVTLLHDERSFDILYGF